MKSENFEEHPLKGLKVPNGYVAIPVDFYLELLLNTRAITNIEKRMRELCIEAAKTSYEDTLFDSYEPGFLTAKGLAEASLGVIEEFTEADAFDALKEMGYGEEWKE